MLKGKAHRFGDDVDTDVIIPARYLTSSDPDALKAHCMEDVDAEFANKVSPGDVIVAGANFGCGSSREHAPIAIKAAGVSVVIAKSFARIFFRNAFNIGLPIVESAAAAEGVEAGDEIEVDLSAGSIKNLTKGAEYKARPVPEFMETLIAAGGLIEHTKKRLAEGGTEQPAEAEEVVEETEKAPGSRMMEIEKAAADEPKGQDAPWEEDEAPPPVAPGEQDEDEDEDEDDDEEEEE